MSIVSICVCSTSGHYSFSHLVQRLRIPFNTSHVTQNNIAVTESKMNIRDAGIYFDFVPVKIMDGDLFSDEGTQFFVSVPIQWGLLSEV